MKKVSFLAAWLMLAGITTGTAFAQAPIQFNARALVAISDADLSASALVDGNRYTTPGTRDQLTYISFPLNRNGQSIGTSNTLSNSMALTDKVLAIAPNGRLGFVVEGRGQLSDSLATIKGITDFPATNYMFAVDLSSPQKPLVKYRLPVGAGGALTAVALAPNGTSLVIASTESGKELKLIDLDASSKPKYVLTSASPVPGVAITDVTFHPGGQFVAYTTAAGEVGIMKYVVDEKTKKPYVAAHGKPVKVGTQPGSGKFTADGKHYVVADSKENKVFVVEFGTDETPVDAKIASQVATSEAPEAVAISPDGSVVAVISSMQSGQPFTNAAAGKSELALFALSGGQLTAGGKAQIDGVMPQAVEFDKTGDNLAIAIPEYLDYGMRNGGIEFYKVTKGAQPSLTKQPGRISLTRGVHAIRVVN
ncbi:WD40 repeat domain-containing protein [Fibrella forsythiae]|uniref:WD40 repeat domain-containing protein n=1 Tax=Fibrella forsythiae TaxID=2817061 RepID=A0ABS3JQ79_9BACT|nr:WD40 repeat domain-containing protein [Fibrella forsythiae]MBO0952152.1 WD40 repeat domain-containing protein [Fibrella forsythiae]